MNLFLPKKINFLLLFISLLSLFGLVFATGRVFAADAIPSPGRLPCDTESNPEFSSDRPYQASPCGDRPITYFCGNSVVVDLGNVSTPYCDTNNGQQTICPCKGKDCDHTGSNAQNIDVDLTNVQLPILGNTQLTINSQNSTDQIDDATKVNEYISWYLNGTIDKAEYPATDTTIQGGVSKIIDFSGPLKKLLPSVIQDSERIDSINQASQNVTYTPDNSENPQTTPTTTTEAENHNQIVVCYNKQVQILPSWLTNFLGVGAVGLGKAVPVPCYNGGGGSAQGSILRLKNWDNSPFDVAYQAIQNWILSNNFLPQDLVSQIIASATVGRWPKKTPPLPWADQNGKPFASTQAYQKAYNEWRGELCAYIPNPFGGNQILACIGIPGVTNSDYAELYKYVPLANTTDKQGSQMISSVSFQHNHVPEDSFLCPGKICSIIKHSPVLFLAHSLEDYQLTNSLKSTFVPEEQSSKKPTIPADVVDNSQACKIVPSRTNPGDDATFTVPESHIEVVAQYQVTNIECTNIHQVCTDVKPKPGSTQTQQTQTGLDCHYEANCSAEIYATIASVSKTAYADEIWQNTVAGNNSIFRRMFPKTGATSPVTCILDTPAQSPATYTLNSNSSPGLSLFRVIEPDGSSIKGSGGNSGSNSIDANLYFPHYGGVLDYFLNGIQTALRPKGFGGPPIQSEQNGIQCLTQNNVCDGKLFKSLNPPGATTDKAKGYFETYIKPKLTPDLMNVYALAEKATGVPCEVLAGVHFEEGDNNPNQSLQNGGPLNGTLLASAIQAGDEIKAKVGGKISSWNQMITALSRYNGGGNSNCGVAPGYTGPCPPPEGIDDVYPTAWIDPQHLVMFLIYCSDYTQCSPYPEVIRPGVLPVAVELYNSESH